VCSSFDIKAELYEKSRFNDTPILVGTNSNEGGLFMRGPITAAAFEKQIRSGYGARADVMLKAYPHSTDAEAARSSADVFREFAIDDLRLTIEKRRKRSWVPIVNRKSIRICSDQRS
jgi:hypothetical protein